MERSFNAPVKKVWQAITNKDEMKQWYFNLAAFEPKVGFEFTFSAENEGRVFIHLCKITEVVPGKKITYSWQYKGYDGISFVTFELFAEGDKTRLKLTHKGIETFPQNIPDFARNNFEQGWTYILDQSLKKYVE